MGDRAYVSSISPLEHRLDPQRYWLNKPWLSWRQDGQIGIKVTYAFPISALDHQLDPRLHCLNKPWLSWRLGV